METNLTNLTIQAVEILLVRIAAEKSYGPIPGGNYASFAAQALKDLMQCQPLQDIVQAAVSKELKKQKDSIGR